MPKGSPGPKKHVKTNRSSSGLQFSDKPPQNGAKWQAQQPGKQQGGWGPPAESPGACAEASSCFRTPAASRLLATPAQEQG